MLELQLPPQPIARFGHADTFDVGTCDAAAALSSIFDPSSLVFSSLQMHAPHKTRGSTLQVSLGDDMSKPSLKRKRSQGDQTSQPKKRAGVDRSTPTRRNSEDSLDQKRTKLGYHRTSIACGHCRRRKIRCLMQDGDTSNKCINCTRLKRECSFHPVDQSIPTSKSKYKAAKGGSKAKRALSPTNTVPPPKRGLSDGAVHYSSAPSSSSIAQDFRGFQVPKTLSPELLKSPQELYPGPYPPHVEQNWLSPGMQPPMSEPAPSAPFDYPGNGLNAMWDSATSPSAEPLNRSLSWHDVNQHASPQSTFTPLIQDFPWSRPPQKAASFPDIAYEKRFIPQSSSMPPQMTMGPLFDSSSALVNESLSDPRTLVTSSEALSLQLQTTLPEGASLLLPNISISQSPSPFPDQPSWPIYTGHGEQAAQSGHYEGQTFQGHWY